MMAHTSMVQLLLLALFSVSTYGFISPASWLISGPVEGLRCDSSAVQLANSDQLHAVLAELANSTFFRLVRVNGSGICPIEHLRPKTDDDVETCNGVIEPPPLLGGFFF